MTEDRRRSSDKEIGILMGQMQGVQDSLDEQATERQRMHAENTKKLDEIAGLRPRVESLEYWRIGIVDPALKRGDEVARIVSNTQIGVTSGFKGLKLGLMLGGSGAVGAGVVKVMGLIAAALPH